jgi:hypothetical protein
MRRFSRAMYTRVLTLAVGCWLSSACLAQSAWVTNLVPVQVITGNDASGQYVQLITTPTPSASWGCQNSDSFVTRTLPRDTVAMALTALALGKSLRLFVKTTCDAILGRPTFTVVGIM